MGAPVTKQPLKLSEEIAECRRQASECREKARLATDRRRKKFFLKLEHRWLSQARILELTELLSDSQKRNSPKSKK